MREDIIKELKMRYNLFVNAQLNTYNILDIGEDQLAKVIHSYKFKKEAVFIEGTKYYLRGLTQKELINTTSKKNMTSEELDERIRNDNRKNNLSRKYYRDII